MDYTKLDKADFDAIVTGELTHFSLWFEGEINNIISDFFIDNKDKLNTFQRLILYRDGLTFQDKIEIVRAMIPLFEELSERIQFKKILKEIEEFKSMRNAMAHGLEDSSDDSSPKLRIHMISRSGKEIVREITPETHKDTIEEAERLLEQIQKVREIIKVNFECNS